ncbi:hypothetical protein EVAR_81001_1 [Eumeta japonica]|uniref:Uncharacterized protein n=1 Tax=Eumeta variegata TaxID=151549 RepID=A0A4C1ZYC6_EUMVA|nr:hypothetical protein EVAR_81001_1 [Eumeta japonica]
MPLKTHQSVVAQHWRQRSFTAFSRTAKPNNWRHTDAGIQRVYRRQCAKSRFGVRYSIRTRSQKVSAQMQITEAVAPAEGN